MPVHGAPQFLGKAIESILHQSFSDFEFLIISERGTSGRAIEMIESYNDVRIRHIHNKKRLGLALSLNVGLKVARGEYVARMDADDISIPNRLEMQVRFLDEHPNVGIVGTAVAIIDDGDRVLSTTRVASEPCLVEWQLLFGDLIAHASVLVRKKVYQKLGGYNPDVLYAEDYDLWVRATRITKISNIDHVLLELRVHSGSVSREHAQAQMQNSFEVSRRVFRETLGCDVPVRIRRGMLLHSVLNARDAMDTAKSLYEICERYISRLRIVGEQQLILSDAASRLYELALICGKRNPALAVDVWTLIVRSSPTKSLFFASSTLTRIVRYSWSRILRRRIASSASFRKL